MSVYLVILVVLMLVMRISMSVYLVILVDSGDSSVCVSNVFLVVLMLVL